MAYNSGTFTIGTASSDYLTCNAAIADYGGGAGLSGDLTWIIEADTSWTTDFNLIRHNGFTFKITSNNPHNGDVNGGVEITLGASIDVFNSVATAGSTNIVENVILKSGSLSLQGQSSLGSSIGCNNTVRNCIVLNAVVLFAQVEVNSFRALFYNNLVINSLIRYDYTYGATPFSSGTSIVENNSFGHGGGAGTARLSMQGGAGGSSKANLIVKNNVVRTTSGGSEGFLLTFQGLIAPLAYNNGSTNSTAITPIGGTWQAGSSNNIASVVDSDFESVNSAASNFLKLPKGQLLSNPVVEPIRGINPLRCKFNSASEYSFGSNNLFDAGLVPTLSTVDLAGATYGKYGAYPIGCYNAEVAY